VDRYQVRYTAFRIPAPRPSVETSTDLSPVTVYRPVLPVRLDFHGRVSSIYAIADSGADQCLFPSFLLPILGLTTDNAPMSKFAGAGSSNQVSWFFDDIGITIGSIPRFEATVSFSSAMNPTGLGLLGQSGFFSRFKVEFDLPNGFFYVQDGFADGTLSPSEP
jgi:hypothetical protein